MIRKGRIIISINNSFSCVVALFTWFRSTIKFLYSQGGGGIRHSYSVYLTLVQSILINWLLLYLGEDKLCHEGQNFSVKCQVLVEIHSLFFFLVK